MIPDRDQRIDSSAVRGEDRGWWLGSDGVFLVQIRRRIEKSSDTSGNLTSRGFRWEIEMIVAERSVLVELGRH